MITNLNQLHEVTVLDGGFNKRRSREIFRRITSHQVEYEDRLFGVASETFLEDGDAIKSTFGIPLLENKIVSTLLTEFLGSAVAIKAFLLFGGCGLLILLYLGWSAKRCCTVNKIRNRPIKPYVRVEENNFSELNYVLALIDHVQMDINVNDRDLNEVKAYRRKVLQDLDEVKIRMQAKWKSITDANAPPPNYETEGSLGEAEVRLDVDQDTVGMTDHVVIISEQASEEEAKLLERK